MDNDLSLPIRKIIHIDMDAFYASVEQRDNPDYRGKAIAVGGSPQGRGVVATASYEARKFGVRSAMSSHRALQLCPHIIFVPPRFAVYKETSQKIREIFHRYTDIVEPLSLDEAYLDVTENKQQLTSAIDIARRIKASISEELSLTASAGVSISKFVSKIASDLNKPNGLTFIAPAEVQRFMEELPVEKFYGVGRVTAEKMKSLNLHTGADLKKLTEDELVSHFGKSGYFYYKIVRGIDHRPVQPYRAVKSVGAEDTFSQDLSQLPEMAAELVTLAGRVAERMVRHGLKGRTMTLKIKYSDFRQVTRNTTIHIADNEADRMADVAISLLQSHVEPASRVRLLGITISNFYDHATDSKATEGGSIQLKLF